MVQGEGISSRPALQRANPEKTYSLVDGLQNSLYNNK